MSSLKALERMKADLIKIQCELFDDNCNDERVLAVYQLEDYQTIKQDLECKEQLEIADRNNQNLVKTNVELVNKNLELQKEIAELKDQISYLKEDGEEWQSAYEWSQAKNSILKLENQELKKENQKLKKDYNLLDTTMESDDRIINSLLNEKEQLQNDIKLNETQIDDLTLEVANYKHALEEKNEIIMDLKDLGVKIGREKYQLDKIIEIIKNKCVSNTNLWLVVCSRNYEDYKSFVENKDHELVRIEHNILTQQEYELLKEVFGNE